MKIDDLERALKNAKYLHLADSLLISYRDQELDEISRRQADAHLELCLICERRLSLFREEAASLHDPYEVPPPGTPPSPADTASKNRLAGYSKEAVSDWQAYFMNLTPV